MGNLPFFVGIGGQAGEGVESLGQAMGTLLARMGFEVLTNGEFHNAIKGSHNAFQISAGSGASLSFPGKYQVVVAMDKESYDQEAAKLMPGGKLIFDPAFGTPNINVKLVPIPFLEMAERVAGTKLAKNMVLFGSLGALVKASRDQVETIVKELFNGKPEKIIFGNVQAAMLGYEAGLPHALDLKPSSNQKEEFLLTGNVLAALAAVKAGCNFFAAYPMTPSTSILQYLAKWAKQADMNVQHVEDELSAINMAIGASYAGARAMTATSGGGYALMTEGVGLAAMLETPVVLIDVQRPGPATGLPTRTGQSDLRQVLHAGQGDVPHMVMSPGSHEEIFQMVRNAFGYAEVLGGPVTVLMEKCLAESLATLDAEVFEDVGISLNRQVTNGLKQVFSYEHNDQGLPTEDPEEIAGKQSQRWKKVDALSALIPRAALEGPESSEITVVCWGSTYLAVKEACRRLGEEGIVANFLHVKYFRPFQPGVAEALEKSKRIVLVEGNQTAQLGGLIREQTGIDIYHKILDVTGRPFTAEELAEKIKALV